MARGGLHHRESAVSGWQALADELGDRYVDASLRVYADRVPPEADLVTYWFEKARAMIEADRAKRAGLLATQAIRAGRTALS